MSEKGDKEEKGTRTGGTGSQGNDTGATSSGKDRPANWDYANREDDSSIGNTQPPPGSIRNGPKGGEGAENTANGAAVGGAFGIADDPPSQGLPGGDPRGNFGGQSGGGSGGVGSGETRGKK